MTAEYWFADQDRNRRGPVEEGEIGRLIQVGTIGPDTQIWTAGMPEWVAAGQVPAFAALFSGPIPPALLVNSPVPPALPAELAPLGFAPPPPAYSGDSQGGYAAPGAAMRPSLPVWGLFWRLIVFGIANAFVIPAPWTNAAMYRFVADHIALPNGARLRFTGRAADIWWVFILNALLAGIGASTGLAFLITLPLQWVLAVLIIRWFCAKLQSEDGRVNITFAGGFWGYIGWNALLILSIFTIIGWAWVIRAMMQWICQNVRGAPRFAFNASGGAILGNTLLFVLGATFVIPIPWLARWYANWFISQFSAA